MPSKEPDEPTPTDDRPHRGPWIRLDDLELTEREDGRGYDVVIEGINLRSAVVPPQVTVGGTALEDVSVAPDGRTITGRLTDEPADRHVVVDYGFARDELADEE